VSFSSVLSMSEGADRSLTHTKGVITLRLTCQVVFKPLRFVQ